MTFLLIGSLAVSLLTLANSLHDSKRGLARMESSSASFDAHGHVAVMSQESATLQTSIARHSDGQSESFESTYGSRLLQKKQAQFDHRVWPFSYVACAISSMFSSAARKQLPVFADTIIIHMRVGDVLDDTKPFMQSKIVDDYLNDWVRYSDESLRGMNKLYYVVPRKYFAEEMFMPLQAGHIKKAVLMANPYFRVRDSMNPRKSLEYIEKVQEILQTRGLEVELRLSQDHRSLAPSKRLVQEAKDADNDVLNFMEKKWGYAVTGGGGFADLLSHLARARGIAVYSHSKYGNKLTERFWPAQDTIPKKRTCSNGGERLCHPRHAIGFYPNPKVSQIDPRAVYRLSDMFRIRWLRDEIGRGSLFHIQNFPGSLAAMYLQATDDEANYEVLLDCIDMKLEQESRKVQ